MRRHKMRVMLLGGSDGRVSEELLHGADVGTAGEQLDGEGVAEAMRVSVGYAGERAESLNRTAHVARAASHGGVVGPEKVVRMLGGEGDQRFDGIGMEQDFERHAGLLSRLQREVAGRGVKCGAAELGHVADTKAAIEEGIDEGAGAFTDVRSTSGVVAGQAIAGGDELAELLGCEE